MGKSSRPTTSVGQLQVLGEVLQGLGALLGEAEVLPMRVAVQRAEDEADSVRGRDSLS